VKKHCDPMRRESDQDTPLHKAAQNGEQDCTPSCLDENKFTPLHSAAKINGIHEDCEISYCGEAL